MFVMADDGDQAVNLERATALRIFEPDERHTTYALAAIFSQRTALLGHYATLDEARAALTDLVSLVKVPGLVG